MDRSLAFSGGKCKQEGFCTPLKPDEAKVMLSLAECSHAAHELGNYDRELDYGQAPNPPLGEADADWVRQIVSSEHE
jgi:hypothetical protein